MLGIFISIEECKVLALAVDLYLNDLEMREDKLFERKSVTPLDASDLLYLKQIVEKKGTLQAIQAKFNEAVRTTG